MRSKLRRRPPHIPTLVLALVLGLAVFPARGASECLFNACPQSIDDFQPGAYPPAPGGFDFTQSGLETGHVLSGTRHASIDPTPTHRAGMVPAGGGSIAFELTTQEPGTSQSAYEPDLLLDYPFDAPFDLSFGGRNDRIVIDVIEVDQVSVLVKFRSQGSTAGTTLLLHPGGNVVYLSEVSPYVDITAIDRISFYFNEYAPDSVAHVRMARIRLTGPTLKDLLLDLPQLVQQDPPFNDPGPLMRTSFFDEEAGASLPTIGMAPRVETASAFDAEGNGIGSFAMLMATGDNDPSDSPGSVAGYEFVDSSPDEGCAAGHFELRLRIDAIGDFGIGISEVAGISPTPFAPQGGEASSGSGTFQTLGIEPTPFTPQDIFVNEVIQLLDATGRQTGHQILRLRLRFPDESAYRVQSAGVEVLANEEFAVSFDVARVRSGEPDGNTLFSMSFDGAYAPYFTTTAAPLPRDGLLSLNAFPSVASDRTMLQFNRPLRRPAELQIFDVAGRRVRSLSLDPGRTQMDWDTRDDQGHRVASGVYLIRVRDGATQATGKLTIVR